MMSEENRSRRSVLKVVSASILASTGLSSVSIAKSRGDTPDEIYRKACKIQEKTDSKKAFRKFLRNRGFNLSYNTDTWSRSDLFGDEIGAQELHKDMFSQTLTLSEYNCEPDYIYPKIDWEHKYPDYPYQAGVDPKDVIGLYWPSTDYSRIDDTTVTGSHVCDPDTNQYCGDLDPNGVAVEYDDQQHHYDMGLHQDYDGPKYMGSYFSLKLLKNNPSDPPESRIVTGDYFHNYSGGWIDNISVGTGGISYNFGSSTKRWNANIDQGENNKDNRTCY